MFPSRFFDNYRLNRHHVKIKSDAYIARSLIQFYYTGLLQPSFSHIEKYFPVASKLALDIALEVIINPFCNIYKIVVQNQSSSLKMAKKTNAKHIWIGRIK